MNPNFRGGFGGGMNMQNLMRQAQKMQEEMAKAKEEIENSQFSASVGGGMVEVVALGTKRIKSIKINPQVVDADDVEMLEDLIVAGINDALAQIESAEKDKMPNIPGVL